MTRPDPSLSPELRALLEHERAVPPVPARVRARVLERARAALIAGRVSVPAGSGRASRLRWGATIALACAASAAIAATAYELGAHRRAIATDAQPSPGARVVTAPAAPPSPARDGDGDGAPVIAPPPGHATSGAPSPALQGAHPSPGNAGPDELRLLRQARASIARQDYAGALGPIAEHARRFKHGRLAEEREALRVKALSALGRTEEARRAADAFEARFPRSVLLPAVTHMPASRP